MFNFNWFFNGIFLKSKKCYHCVFQKTFGQGSLNECDECQKVFPTTQKMLRHIRNVHTKEGKSRPKCDICLKVFENKSYLSYHIKHTH